MTNKDLFNGLNNIDDDLILESMRPAQKEKNKKNKWKKILRATQISGAVAAVLAVAVLGYEVVSLSSRIKSIEESGYNEYVFDKASSAAEAGMEVVGVESDEKLGETYTVAKNYGDVYDKLQELEEESAKDGGFMKGFSSGAVDYATDDAEYVEEAAVAEEAPAAASDSTSTTDSGAVKGEDGTYSTTNVMTQGVDESDIVKTDGKYIYMVESGQISITDIRDGEPGQEYIFVPEFKAPSDMVHEMYVDDCKLILITSHIKSNKVNIKYYRYYCSVGLDEEVCCYTYDVSDPSNPKLIGSMTQDGSYNTSRKVDETVYIFTNLAINRPDRTKTDAVKEENLSEWIPKVNDTPIASGCIYMGGDEQRGMLISSYSVDEPEKTIDAKYIESGYAQVYVSSDAMYFYQTNWASREITYIDKMNFADGKMTAGASTSINGTIQDSFAISQQKGYLFVLATEYNNGEVNTLHVFDKNMKQVGIINEIARGEQIYAARYVGNYVYFITYKQVDPLFVADISDPTNPKIIGELEVDGFSEYLHVWDETHILGIGFMTDDNARRQGIRYTMFDVSDPANPKEENSLVIGEDAYAAGLSGNYKAILADSGKNLIGLAMEDYNDNKGTSKTTYELLTYDSNKGFKIVKETDLNNQDTSGYRGIYSGDDFYIAGNGEIIYFPIDIK